MMNTTQQERNVYEDFELETDILYFKIGALGLVSFHGRNYNIKKRMSAEQMTEITNHSSFYPIRSNCYINIGKIHSITSGVIYFGSKYDESKQLIVPRRKQYMVQQLFAQRAIDQELRITP